MGPDLLHTVGVVPSNANRSNTSTAIAFESAGSEFLDHSSNFCFDENKTATADVQNNTGSAARGKLITVADTDSDSLGCTVVVLDKLVAPKSELTAIEAALVKTES